MLHILLVAIYTIARTTSPRWNRLNILDRVFIYWSLTGHMAKILMQVLVTRYFVVPTLWEQYVGSFGQRDEVPHVEPEHTGTPRGLSPSRSETAQSPSDDSLADGMLVPPWESHPHPYDRHYKQSLLDEQHQPPRTINPPNKENPSSPWWRKRAIPTWLTLPKMNLTFKFNLGNTSTKKEPTRKGKGKKKNHPPKRRGGRKLPRTDSMIVEAAGTEYDRTSWRSGDYLLGEEYYRQVNTNNYGEGRLTGWS